MTRRILLAALVALSCLSPARAGTASGFEPPELKDEATRKLSEYLRVDTTNPPGREAAAADLLARWLAAEGIAVSRFESAPGRVNLVARLKGRSEHRGLLLLHHMDVVEADPRRWKAPPFGGQLRDGMLVGRGAMDMKGMGVMELLVFVELARRKIPLERDVVLAAVADEEAGGRYGAQWLLEHHPEAVACDHLLNEGSFGLEAANGAQVAGIQTAERGVLWLKMTARGAGGHGSVAHPDSAPSRLIRALERLQAAKPRLALTDQTRQMLAALALTESGVRRWALQAMSTPWGLSLIGPRAIAAEPFLGALLTTTINPTVLSAGRKVNVIPPTAEAQIDVRLLPGDRTDQVLARLRERVADQDVRFEVLSATEPTSSPRQDPVYERLQAALRAEYPRCTVTPMLSTGGTDSAFFRARGVRAYGLIPIMASRSQIESMHGDDEAISPDQLRSGIRVLFRTVVEHCAVR